MDELLETRKRAQRFTQLFELIGDGFTEYIALSEQSIQPVGPKTAQQHDIVSEKVDTLEGDQREEQPSTQTPAETSLLMENHRLYKLHAQRLAKLQRDYAGWHQKLDKDSSRLFSLAEARHQSTSAVRQSISRFAPPLLFCRCPSPQRRNRLYRPPSCQSLQLNRTGSSERKSSQNSNNRSELPITQKSRPKSQSVLDLSTEQVVEEEGQQSLRTVRAAMAAIEAEMCGMLGRLQFQVEGIVGFARLCTGDVFEVQIKHGANQRWRTRGKTQPDRSQRWDQQPPSVTLSVLWNQPVQVKVLEVGFLRSRCLSERQFDPAKFASAQPQLVTMNLNSVGSIKLRLVVSWLPLLSSKIVIPINGQLHQQQQQQQQLSESANNVGIVNGKLKQHQSQHILPADHQQNSWHSPTSSPGARLPPKVPPKRNLSLHSACLSPSLENGQQQRQSPVEATADDSPVKVCLRDKKRQREQRIQMGVSVAASMSSGIGRVEASKADKERWRCSSTMLLDDLYKDLSKSIPTIDDLSAIHPKSSSIGGREAGSVGPGSRSFTVSDGQPCSSSSTSEGRSKSGAKRIFSFVKRATEDGSRAREAEKADWRKSVSLGQIALARDDAQSERQEVPEEPEEFKENYANVEITLKEPNGSVGGKPMGGSGSTRRNKLSNLKKGRSSETASLSEGRSSQQIETGNGCAASMSSYSRASSMDSASSKCLELERALRTADALLDKIEMLRVHLAKLRPAEYTELVGFEAAMLNWEACLKLNRSGILCQLDAIASSAVQNGISNGSSVPRNRASGQQIMRHRLANNRNSLYLHQNGQQHSPSTASDETDEGTTSTGGAHQREPMLDHISENDSGIDSLRQYHSPYNSSSSSSKHNATIVNAASADGQRKLAKDRRKSIGAMLDVLQPQISLPVNQDVMAHQSLQFTATGTAQMDKCLDIHLDRAEQALQAICQVQDSPFEYTLTKMLCRMEGIETIALESMLGLVQDLLANCQPNPQNVLLQLGLQFQLQQCWLSACPQFDAFLLAPLAALREQLRPLCEPIVRTRYTKLVEKVLDALCSMLSDTPPDFKTSSETQTISVFQFVALFRGKQFSAFIENLSHEAWIIANLLSGQPSAIRDVMERLRNVPVVPPLESLRHIGIALAVQPPKAIAPIEKYLHKAAPELAQDLAACFLCLLEHEDEQSRFGACRALATLKQESAIRCLDFLSRSDSSPRVRVEAQKSAAQIHKFTKMQQEMTKI